MHLYSDSTATVVSAEKMCMLYIELVAASMGPMRRGAPHQRVTRQLVLLPATSSMPASCVAWLSLGDRSKCAVLLHTMHSSF